jgi:hypothetical protein
LEAISRQRTIGLNQLTSKVEDAHGFGLANVFGFSCGPDKLASRIHVATTSASRIMVA